MSFSPEILEQIFLHLDKDSLLACIEVSNYFRECVLTSPSVMRKLPLRINSRNWRSKLAFVKNHGNKVKTLELKWNNNSGVYLKFLHFTPMVTKLSLDLTDTGNPGNPRSKAATYNESFELNDAFAFLNQEFALDLDAPIDLSDLTEFSCRVYRGDPGTIIARFSNVSRLRSLNIHCSIESLLDYDILVDTLARQRHLKTLELKVERIDKIFTRPMPFRLQKLTLVPASPDDHEYKTLNDFLATQRDCLEELRAFSWKLNDSIAEGICALLKLKRLTTHVVPPFLETSANDTNCVVMENLTHFRYYASNTSENFETLDFSKTLPKLECLNVHFGLDHRLFPHNPEVKVESNPLRNLQNLIELHIESHNQNLLHHLASPNLRTLATTCEDALFDIASWLQMGKSLPRLETLIIGKVEKRFLKFIASNQGKYVQKLRNLRNLVLRDHDNEVLHMTVEGGKVTRVANFFRESAGALQSLDMKLWTKFENFEMVPLSDDEFDERYEFWTCYFHQCGP